MKRGEYVPGEDGKPGAWLLESGVVEAQPAIDLTEHVRSITLDSDTPSAFRVGETLRFEIVPLPDEDNEA